MKELYLKPEVLVSEIEMQGVLCLSGASPQGNVEDWGEQNSTWNW